MKEFIVKIRILVLLGIIFFFASCSNKKAAYFDNSVVFGDSSYMKSVPPPPGKEAWKFIEDLKAPMWSNHHWEAKGAGAGQVDLSGGVILKKKFPDPDGLLETAYDDLNLFFAAGDVSVGNNGYPIEFLPFQDLEGEAFRLEISSKGCRILAGELEGIRRGIFYLEDEMLRMRAPHLQIGTIEKEPAVKKRISRCFFSPINHRTKVLGQPDELMDDVDYYPDNYLNRLAHEGVNGLWLFIDFRDLISTRFTPEYGKDGKQRLAKLRRTVEKCLRYGIKMYIFGIEPSSWDGDNTLLTQFGGGRNGKLFCPYSKEADEYLYEAVNGIFSAVPELGGMILITVGERQTTCVSAIHPFLDYNGQNVCPRCGDKKPWEILSTSLSAMQRGMKDASPNAELISWMYIPYPQRFYPGDNYKMNEWVYDIAANTPKGVVLQFNFETGVEKEVFGKRLMGGDYWLSEPGPSDRFVDMANVARKHGTPMSAKIQTGNSHEVATIPYVPVPSLLFKKFSAMHDLGVSHTMLCWYFGNYPGVMNKAAGLLSMKPFPKDEMEFLRELASLYWRKEDVPKVVDAWKHFAEGYGNYPLTNLFQYYGPINDGPVWPLLLTPTDAILSPAWIINSSGTKNPWPPSGDRIGECIDGVLDLDEAVELTLRMSTAWDKGVSILEELEEGYINERERMLDIGVAKALSIQFRSGYNILNFYMLREKMLRMEGRERLGILTQLTNIIEEEISLSKQLLEHCKNDSRLGFNGGAEGYKYYPEKIEWRIGELKKILENDVPVFKNLIKKDELLFPEYTGKQPQGAVAYCTTIPDVIPGSNFEVPAGLQWQALEIGNTEPQLQWASSYDSQSMFFWITENSSARETMDPQISNVRVIIEPRRLYPAAHFTFSKTEKENLEDPLRNLNTYSLIYSGGFREIDAGGQKYVVLRIPFSILKLDGEELSPIRIDVVAEADGEKEKNSWRWRSINPLPARLILGRDNPADLGWLLFE